VDVKDTSSELVSQLRCKLLPLPTSVWKLARWRYWLM